jgi:FkbM family methyltransferase
VYLLVALLAVLSGAMLIWKISTLRILMLITLGRSWCPLAEAMAAPRNAAAKVRVKAELTKRAKIVKKDGECILWDVSGEQYWLPSGSRILPGMLAEQKLGAYEAAGYGVRAGDVVLDCGASIGLYTLHALQLGASHVIAVEPSPRNLECLRRNLTHALQDQRVTIVPKGVWDEEETRTLQIQASNSAADSVALKYRGSMPGPDVPLTTIDLIVHEFSPNRLDYIKMDVEGAEEPALQGAIETIRRFHPRMTIAMEHRFHDAREIPRVVAAIAENYRVGYGPCVEIGKSLRPTVLDFY